MKTIERKQVSIPAEDAKKLREEYLRRLKLLKQRGGFEKAASKSAARVLSVQEIFKLLGH